MFMGPTAHAQFAQLNELDRVEQLALSAEIAPPRYVLRSSVGLPVLLLAAAATLPWVLAKAIAGAVTRSIPAAPGR